MSLLVARTTGRAQAPIIGDPVTHSLKASQLFGIDVDHVAGSGPLVAAQRLGWLQVLEPAKPYGLEHSANGGELFRKQPGDASEGAELMTQLNRVLQLMWIDATSAAGYGARCVDPSRQRGRQSDSEPATCRQCGG